MNEKVEKAMILWGNSLVFIVAKVREAIDVKVEVLMAFLRQVRSKVVE